MKQNEKGMAKVRGDLQDVADAINKEIVVIEKVVSQIEEDCESEPEIAEQLINESQFKRFIQGMFVILRILELQIENSTVAEMQEDDEFSIEIEALKMEAETCK